MLSFDWVFYLKSLPQNGAKNYLKNFVVFRSKSNKEKAFRKIKNFKDCKNYPESRKLFPTRDGPDGNFVVDKLPHSNLQFRYRPILALDMDDASLEKFGVKPDVPPPAGAQNSNDKIAALAACLSYIEGLESALDLWGAANLHIEKPPGM